MKILNLKSYFLNHNGQSLIELLVAIGLAAVLLPALLTGVVASREGKAQESERLLATGYMREMTEAVRSVRETSWNTFAVDGTFYPAVSGSAWSLVSGSESINGFTRQLVISGVQRDSGGAIVASGGTVDPSTKQVDYTVSWTNANGGSLTATEYFTRYLNNTALTQTTQADFDGGTLSHTRTTSTGGGTVELSPGTGGIEYTDDYNNSGDYTFDSGKIEVTGGYAQLKNTGSSNSGSTTNSDFASNITGWTFAKFNTDKSQTGTWQSSGGNPGGYAKINFPFDKNQTTSGYFHQSFTTTTANPTASLTFQWNVSAYPTTADSLHLYAFVDTGSGAPTLAQNVWDSGNITASSGWSGTVTIDVASKVTTAGTYYVKLVAVLDYQNGSNTGPYTIGFDNASLAWSGTASSYASDSPTITPLLSLNPVAVTSWDSFSSTEVLNGGSIRYQLSDDDGATWKYHAGGASTNWVAAGATDYNSATEVNQKIAGFPIINSQIKVKAFLIGNGTQQVKLDSITIGYTGTSGSNLGTFTSSTMDVGSSAAFNSLAWAETNTANTTTQIQLAINSDNSSWTYLGPDGTINTYYTGGFGTIPFSLSSGRYIRYKIYFNSSNNDLPNVSDVSISYSP